MLGALLALVWLLGVPVASGLTTIVLDNLELGVQYNHFVNSSVEIIFIFSNVTQVCIKFQWIVLRIKLCATFSGRCPHSCQGKRAERRGQRNISSFSGGTTPERCFIMAVAVQNGEARILLKIAQYC
jgi:hypothetical protein